MRRFVFILFPAFVACSSGDDPEPKEPAGGGTTGGSAGASGSASGGGNAPGGSSSGASGKAVGEACQADGDCAAIEGRAGRCKTAWNGGYCTADCDAAESCGAGASCEAFENEMLCAKSCSGGAADCRNGYFCRDMRACIGAS